MIKIQIFNDRNLSYVRFADHISLDVKDKEDRTIHYFKNKKQYTLHIPNNKMVIINWGKQ